MMPPDPVSIVGFAASTSLGYSLEPTLAAMGANLSNFTDTSVPNGFGQPVVAASLIDVDVSRGERLVSLLRHGFEDASSLVARYGLRDVPLLVGLASDLTPDEEKLLTRVIADTSFVGETAWFPHGRASTFAALAAAMNAVGRSHRFVLVAGVDSLCAPAQVQALGRAGRVLSPLTEGTIPGEAAAFALLARADDPLVEAATSVRLEAVALQRAATPFTEAEAVSGDALAGVFRSFRERGARPVHRVIAAHSGEGYFGRSFAHAYLREVEVMPEPLEVELITDRVGDVGAAAGILGLAFGVYLMVEDGREGARRALAYSESDTGEVGAAILEGTPTSWRRSAADSGE